MRFQNLFIEGDAYVGTRALPTLLNSTLNTLEVKWNLFLSLLSVEIVLIE